MIKIKFQDTKELRERLVNPRRTDIEKGVAEINDYKPQKNVHEKWYVTCGTFILPQKGRMEVEFWSNGKFYSAKGDLSENSRIPDIENYIGNQNRGIISSMGDAMFYLENRDIFTIGFGNNGTKKRSLNGSMDEFETDLSKFSDLLETVINAQYLSGNIPNLNYYLNPK